MKRLIKIAPPNSLFFLQDPGGGTSPEIDQRSIRIWSTKSRIIIGCLAFMDGETELTVSTEDTVPEAPAFDGILDTPNKAVEVSTSEKQILMRCDVASRFTRVRVWTDHPTEPEKVFVTLG